VTRTGAASLESSTMEHAEFLHLLDLLGPDLQRWPAEHAARAESLWTTSEEARQAAFQAIRLDWILQSCRGDVDEDAVRRIIGRFSEFSEKPAGRFWGALRTWGLVPLWPRVSFLAAALAVGVLVGVHFQQLRAANASLLGQVAWLIFDSYPLLPWER
jgi:hypothetical protein